MCHAVVLLPAERAFELVDFRATHVGSWFKKKEALFLRLSS